MSREAMKQALEALENVYLGARDEAHYEAITALRQALEQLDYQTRYDRPCYKCRSNYCPGDCQALEQPADESVALTEAVFTVLEGFTLPHDVRKILEAALYTRPQPAAKRKPMTDAEIERNWQFLHDEEGNPPDHYDFARAIEAAHGITGEQA